MLGAAQWEWLVKTLEEYEVRKKKIEEEEEDRPRKKKIDLLLIGTGVQVTHRHRLLESWNTFPASRERLLACRGNQRKKNSGGEGTFSEEELWRGEC